MKISENLANEIRQSKPLIILGMHRSGTSLLVRLLMKLSIDMGNSLSRDDEAIYFQKINRKVFKSVNATWGNIHPLIGPTLEKDFINRHTAKILETLFPDNAILSTTSGINRFFSNGSLEKLANREPVWWGWKDPRTSMTIPIWIKIFPNAKVLHVLRNGVDVAISTHRRTLLQQQKLLKRILKLDYCPETSDFEYCFHLWEDYVSFILEMKKKISPENYLELRYEDLLQNPEEQIKRICDFIHFPTQNIDLASVVRDVNPKRLDNSIFAQPYQEFIPALAKSPLMEKLNYTY